MLTVRTAKRSRDADRARGHSFLEVPDVDTTD